ncbi:MAG: hypothetical protein U1D06_10655 [Paracoccaceae bacterium]|nr:hypothetical protein [Paracoccaceae bacterium]
MFKLVARPEFTHTVAVMVPIDGGHREESFTARFRLTEDEDARVDTFDGTVTWLREIIISLGDLVDEAGKAIPYSDEVRDRVLALPYARIALARTYFAAVGKARLGN